MSYFSIVFVLAHQWTACLLLHAEGLASLSAKKYIDVPETKINILQENMIYLGLGTFSILGTLPARVIQKNQICHELFCPSLPKNFT